jgi:Holliday junction resolvase
MQQRKGRSGELEISEILNNHGISAEPGQAVSYGATPDVIGVKGIHCEVKRVEKLNVLEAMKQAIRDAEKFKDGLPTLFHRRNRSPWLVTMTLEDWLKLYERWEE